MNGDGPREAREHRETRAQLRGKLVEGVRLIFIALFATGGYTIGVRTNQQVGAARAVLYVFLGAATGYVLGGVFGRLTIRAVSGMEEELRRRQPAELAGGTVGLVIALVIAGLLMIPLLFVPPLIGWTMILFIYLFLGTMGFHLGQARYEDLFGLIGMKPRASASARGDIHVIDTSALIDGRVADLVNTGFITGTLLLHDGVLRELQSIADASDHRRRARGRRGLDILVELQKAPTVQIQLVEELGVQDVDAALVRLAKERGGTLVTVDHNLARVAEALRVPVAQINSLATKFRTPFNAGDELTVHLVKEGREHGQGVGYLDDGTMVVVESANPHIGSDVTVRVKNVIQTTTGRMIFSALPEESGA